MTCEQGPEGYRRRAKHYRKEAGELEDPEMATLALALADAFGNLADIEERDTAGKS